MGGKGDVMMESVKAHNLETAEEKSEKQVTSDDEEGSSNEETRRDENAGATVENSETLKLVLEPDTPIEEEEEIVLSSQVISRSTVTVKSSAQERLERLRKKFGDIAGLENSMNITPRV